MGRVLRCQIFCSTLQLGFSVRVYNRIYESIIQAVFRIQVYGLCLHVRVKGHDYEL